MRSLAAALACLLALTACTHADPAPDTASAPGARVARQPPDPFRPASRTVPDGFTVAQCSDLRRPDRSSGLAVRLSLPPGYAATSRGGAGCDFAGPGFGRDLSLSVGPLPSLRSVKERDVDPFEDEGGDDSVSDIAYVADVPVFGHHRGERLSYHCYCDGQDLDVRIVQARGVRLSWTTPHRKGPDGPTSRAVRRSIGLVHSDRSTCRSRGRTVTFRPPVPQTESIDFYQDRCHLYLRPGRASLLRYAEIELHPRGTLVQRADRLRARKNVTDVRYEPGSDRLTWTTVRRRPGPYQAPTGAWRAVTVVTGDAWVTWSARPRQWRTEADDARRFTASVRP